MQLLLQSTWKTDDPATLLLAQNRVSNLIDLFQECGESVLPIACPYPFFGGDEGGWTPTIHATATSCGFFGSAFSGTAFESCTVLPTGYDQLSVIKALNQRLDALTIKVTTGQAFTYEFYARSSDVSPYGSATLIASGSHIDGTDVEITVGAGLDVTALQIVLTNDPPDGSIDSTILLTEVDLVLENSSGTCP